MLETSHGILYSKFIASMKCFPIETGAATMQFIYWIRLLKCPLVWMANIQVDPPEHQPPFLECTPMSVDIHPDWVVEWETDSTSIVPEDRVQMQNLSSACSSNWTTKGLGDNVSWLWTNLFNAARTFSVIFTCPIESIT